MISKSEWIGLAGVMMILFIGLAVKHGGEETFTMDPVYISDEAAGALDGMIDGSSWPCMDGTLPDANGGDCLTREERQSRQQMMDKALKKLNLTTSTDIPFDWDILDLGGDEFNGLGLEIVDGQPPCVDTHLLTDVSCDDKAAIVKYRKAQADETVRQLKLEIKRLEKEAIYNEFGLMEC